MAGPNNVGALEPTSYGVTGYAFPNPARWGRNEAGNFEIDTYHGIKGAIQDLAVAVAESDPAQAYEVQEGFGSSRLDIKYAFNNNGLFSPETDSLTTWEFYAAHHEKNLLTAIDNAGLVETLSLGARQAIQYQLDNLSNPAVAPVSAATFAGVSGDGDPAGTNALMVFQIMSAGERSYPMEAPILRRTTVTSDQFASGYSLSNVRKLLSTAWMLVNEGLPTGLLFSVNAYMGSDSSSDANLVYGWYKPFPQIEQVANFKWRIIQEYNYGWWAKALFGTPMTP
jgi:hypothetical protein